MLKVLSQKDSRHQNFRVKANFRLSVKMNFSLEHGLFALVWTKQILPITMSNGHILHGQNATFFQHNQKQIKEVAKNTLSV